MPCHRLLRYSRFFCLFFLFFFFSEQISLDFSYESADDSEFVCCVCDLDLKERFKGYHCIKAVVIQYTQVCPCQHSSNKVLVLLRDFNRFLKQAVNDWLFY